VDREVVLGSLEGAEIGYRTFLVYKDAFLTDREVIRAEVVDNAAAPSPELALTFNPDGARRLAEVTGAHLNQRIAVISDGLVQTAPIVMARIEGGKARLVSQPNLDRGMAAADSQAHALALQSGALPGPAEVLTQKEFLIGGGPQGARKVGIELLLRLSDPGLREAALPVLDRRLRLLDEVTSNRVPKNGILGWARQRFARTALFSVALSPEDAIRVRFPGDLDAGLVKRVVSIRANLEFRLVDDQTDLLTPLKGRLPAGIHLENDTYLGSGKQLVKPPYLALNGTREQARARLLEVVDRLYP
jgi:preprotein translocase subunit SecD